MDQSCLTRWRLSSSVTLPAGGPGARAVGRPTIQSGPVVLRPVRATHCSTHSNLGAAVERLVRLEFN